MRLDFIYNSKKKTFNIGRNFYISFNFKCREVNGSYRDLPEFTSCGGTKYKLIGAEMGLDALRTYNEFKSIVDKITGENCYNFDDFGEQNNVRYNRKGVGVAYFRIEPNNGHNHATICVGFDKMMTPTIYEPSDATRISRYDLRYDNIIAVAFQMDEKNNDFEIIEIPRRTTGSCTNPKIHHNKKDFLKRLKETLETFSWRFTEIIKHFCDKIIDDAEQESNDNLKYRQIGMSNYFRNSQKIRECLEKFDGKHITIESGKSINSLISDYGTKLLRIYKFDITHFIENAHRIIDEPEVKSAVDKLIEKVQTMNNSTK